MRYRVLGPLTVDGAAGPATPGAEKLRVVLATLVLHTNSVVSVQTLMDELWPEHAPRTATTTLQVYVSQLRKILDSADPVRGRRLLVTQPPGYQLHMDPSSLDISFFTALHDQGHEAIHARQYRRASDLLREALNVWRAPVMLPDLPHGPSLHTAATHWEEVRLAALEARIRADLRLGQHHALVGELRSLTDEHPLNEDLHAQLMVALYRTGRHADALLAYGRLREKKVNELGIEPGANLRRLHQRVLKGDSALLRPAPGAADEPGPPVRRTLPPGPTEARTDARPAPDAEAHTVRPDAAAKEADDRSEAVPDPWPHLPPGGITRLPPTPARLVGRGPEIDALHHFLDRAIPLVTIHGRPGTGRTALAVLAAHSRRDTHPHAQVLIDLHPGPHRRLTAQEAVALFLTTTRTPLPPDAPDDQLAATAQDILNTHKVVLVLDNATAVEQIAPFIPSRPGSTVLVTALHPLIPHTPHIRLGPLDTAHAVHLLTDEAASGGTEGYEPWYGGRSGYGDGPTGCPAGTRGSGAPASVFASTETSPGPDALTGAAFAGIVGAELDALIDADYRPAPPQPVSRHAASVARWCDNLPLALHAVAAQLHANQHLTVQDVYHRLRDPRHRLNRLTADDPGIRTALDLPYHHLTPQQRHHYRLLALLPAGPVPQWTARALFRTSGHEAHDAHDAHEATETLDTLTREQLLLAVHQHGHLAYRLPGLHHLHAAQLLGAEETPDGIRSHLGQLAHAYLPLVRQAGRRLVSRAVPPWGGGVAAATRRQDAGPGPDGGCWTWDPKEHTWAWGPDEPTSGLRVPSGTARPDAAVSVPVRPAATRWTPVEWVAEPSYPWGPAPASATHTAYALDEDASACPGFALHPFTGAAAPALALLPDPGTCGEPLPPLEQVPSDACGCRTPTGRAAGSADGDTDPVVGELVGDQPLQWFADHHAVLVGLVHGLTHRGLPQLAWHLAQHLTPYLALTANWYDWLALQRHTLYHLPQPPHPAQVRTTLASLDELRRRQNPDAPELPPGEGPCPPQPRTHRLRMPVPTSRPGGGGAGAGASTGSGAVRARQVTAVTGATAATGAGPRSDP